MKFNLNDRVHVFTFGSIPGKIVGVGHTLGHDVYDDDLDRVLPAVMQETIIVRLDRPIFANDGEVVIQDLAVHPSNIRKES